MRKKNGHSLCKKYHKQTYRRAGKPRVLAGVQFGLSTGCTEGTCRNMGLEWWDGTRLWKVLAGGLISKKQRVTKKG